MVNDSITAPRADQLIVNEFYFISYLDFSITVRKIAYVILDIITGPIASCPASLTDVALNHYTLEMNDR